MPNVVFEFQARGAAQVQRAIGATVRAAEQAAKATGNPRAPQAQTQAILRAQANQVAGAQRTATEIARIEAQATAVVKSEASKRVRADEKAERERVKVALAATRDRERAEAQATRTAEREARRRAATASRLTNRVMNTGAQALSTAGSAIHGQIQDVRARRAQNETNLNSTLLQLVPSGANESEVRAMQERVQRYVRENHLDMGATVEALSGAQSRFNALGAASPEARMAALNQTLSDVGFANVINPNDLNGIPQFSAMLRQQGVSDEMRTQILRNTTGISFAGSVETQQAIEQGLPAMLRSLSTTMATAPAGTNRDALVRDSIADFMAQIQTNAASGGRVAVSGNRANTLRAALNNSDTQNRLGNALSQRRMTDEQREVFNRSFSRGRDGRYVMSESVRNSPSEAAAMFGRLFGNDPTAVANFLGPRGGGGKRQLLNRPEAALLTSYFASGQDSQGRTVRQYEAVNDLRRQSISAEQFDLMSRIRGGEDRNNLQDNENARVEALGDNTSALNRVSNALAGFSASNPMLSAALGAGASGFLPTAASALGAGATASSAAGGLAGVGAAGAGAAAVSTAAVLAAGAAGAAAGDLINQYVEGGNIGRNSNGTEQDQQRSIFQGSTWSDLLQELRGLPANLGTAIRSASLNPQAQVHAAAIAATGANSPAPESRANR